jgi:hypothetical protein
VDSQIHNNEGTEGLVTKIDYSPMVKIDNDARKQIIKIASTNPRDLGLKFSTWSLRSFASGYLTKEDKKMVKQGISHTRIRDPK